MDGSIGDGWPKVQIPTTADILAGILQNPLIAPQMSVLGASLSTAMDMCDDEQDKEKICRALEDSILNTCARPTGRKKFKCFEAANKSFRQCMGYE